MERIAKFFVTLASMTDEGIKKILDELEANDLLESTFLRAEIMSVVGNEYRRLKAALGLAVDAVAFSVENIPFMTDEEILGGFIKADANTRALFLVNVTKDATENGKRALSILATVQERLNADKAEAAEAAKKEREERETRERARFYKQALEHPEYFVGRGEAMPNDDIALAYLEKKPWGVINTEAQARSLIRDVDGTEMVRSMMTGKFLVLDEAWTLMRCFVAEEGVVARLQRKLRERGVKIQYHPFTDKVQDGKKRPGLLTFVANRDAERSEEEGRDRIFANLIREVLEPAATSFEALTEAYLQVLEEHKEGGQTQEVPEWKLRIINGVANELEQGRAGVRYRFVGELREKFPRDMVALDSYIEELQHDLQATPDGVVKDAKRRKLQAAGTHQSWLKAHPEGVQERSEGGKFVQLHGTHHYTKGTSEEPVMTKNISEKEDALRRARKFLTSLNYDGQPESRKVMRGQKYPLFADLTDDELLEAYRRLRGAAGQIKADKAKNRGDGKGKKAQGGKK